MQIPKEKVEVVLRVLGRVKRMGYTFRQGARIVDGDRVLWEASTTSST